MEFRKSGPHTETIVKENFILLEFESSFIDVDEHKASIMIFSEEKEKLKKIENLILKAPELLETLKGLVIDVGNLLGENDIEWQQAGYYNYAKE